jgi:hypothetical protein
MTVLPPTQATTIESIALANHICTPGQVLIRRRALNATPFDPRLSGPVEDWKLWLHLSDRGPMAFVDKIVIDYRVHDGNASAALSRMRAAELHVRREFVANPGTSTRGRVAGRRGWRAFERERTFERLRMVAAAARAADGRAALRDLARSASSAKEVAVSMLPAKALRRMTR